MAATKDVELSSLCNGNSELKHSTASSDHYKVSKEWLHNLKKWKTWEKILVVSSLWVAYLLCTTAYSVINPFFPQTVKLLIKKYYASYQFCSRASNISAQWQRLEITMAVVLNKVVLVVLLGLALPLADGAQYVSNHIALPQ